MTTLTLTFDNGPVPGATDAILDRLRDRGLLATFFVIGERLLDPAGRRLAERARAEGHWIGNHTLTHTKPFGEYEEPGHAAVEIGGAEALIGDLASPERFFRPVGRGQLGPHLLTPEARDHLIDHRYTLVTWNNVPRDWVEPQRDWLERAIDGMAASERNLIVLHDHCIVEMLDTLDAFLDRMAADGVEIVQAMPEECLPIRRGRVVLPIDGFVGDAAAPGA
ncbi:polysaccharide deacetylase family protein [Azospirillum sp. RWY-5-1]|uniref:Chitooligosaccharide deacetylase n=1 Tax=Azospirillum oleiclasticum TaxID=2735135 RepID=A0ABX2TE55_9PROT|nr:polysaccharide deacetylase family protein [Azospirillum oleiclasticum]NYZ15593.1 polysaccharide deacetylase family protein [Azospirillum oleiclasticum]NYZ22616.1 polysaccharide deacetylase family protein [Azospirillum oleiclasticum]